MAVVFVYPKTGSFLFARFNTGQWLMLWLVGEERCVPSGSALVSVITTQKLVVSKC